MLIIALIKRNRKKYISIYSQKYNIKTIKTKLYLKQQQKMPHQQKYDSFKFK